MPWKKKEGVNLQGENDGVLLWEKKEGRSLWERLEGVVGEEEGEPWKKKEGVKLLGRNKVVLLCWGGMSPNLNVQAGPLFVH